VKEKEGRGGPICVKIGSSWGRRRGRQKNLLLSARSRAKENERHRSATVGGGGGILPEEADSGFKKRQKNKSQEWSDHGGVGAHATNAMGLSGCRVHIRRSRKKLEGDLADRRAVSK